MSADGVDRSVPSIDVVSIESASDPLLPPFRQLVRDFLTELGENLDYQGVEEELAARQHNTAPSPHITPYNECAIHASLRPTPVSIAHSI